MGVPEQHTFTGVELFDAGFTQLCAIIPPDGELSPQSKIDPSQRGKIPGRKNHSGTWGGYDWINFSPERKHVARWDADGAGIGIVCGVGETPVIGIDIDVTDDRLSQRIMALAEETLGPAPVRTGRWPKTLLPYQLDVLSGPVTWRKFRFRIDGVEHLVEVRGKGQQFVAVGVHPATGEPYTWNGPEIGPATLSVVDSDDLDRFFDELTAWVEREGGDVLSVSSGAGGQGRDGVDQDNLKADDLEHMDRVVAALPNGEDDYPTRDDYVRVGCAIKAAYADDPERGFDAWAGWCFRWEGGHNDSDVILADWSRMKPPFEVGAKWLAEQARLKGGFNDATTIFTPSPYGSPLSGLSTDKADTDSLSSDGSGPDGIPESEFWGRYVWVEGIKRFADLQMGTLLDKEQFNDRWLGRVGSATSGMNAPAGVYMQYDARRVVQGLTYRPMQPQFIDEPDGQMLNAWQPGPAHGYKGERWVDHKATDKDVAPWLDLVRRLVPASGEREHLLDWLAWQIQHPGEKCNWHPLIWGEQGIGKDTLLVPITLGLGVSRKGNAATVQASELSADWTDWYENKSLVVIEEINSFERRSIAEKLKPMLTNPPYLLRVNKKHVIPYDVPNVANFVFLSNHADALPIEGSDRRSFVVHAAVRKTDFPDDYFDDLYGWLDLGGDMMVCGWLAQRDLSAFKAKGDAPRTDAKDAMRRMSLGVIEGVLLSAVEDEDGVFERDLLTMREVIEHVRQQTGGALKVTPHKLGQLLHETTGAEKIGRVRIDGHREYVWAVRRASMYRGLASDTGKLGALYEKQRRDAAADKAAGLFKKQGD